MEKNTANSYKLLQFRQEKTIVYNIKLCYNSKDKLEQFSASGKCL